VYVDVLTGFVDRTRGLTLFRRMLTGESNKRILCILAQAGQGKTCFLLRLFRECRDQDMPVALLDFDPRRGGLTDYLSVAHTIRRHLGVECTPNICACAARMSHLPRLTGLVTRDQTPGVNFGQGNVFTDADVRTVAGGDIWQVFDNIFTGSLTPALAKQQRDEMGQALSRDLAALARAVLLIDAFEHAAQDTRIWLENWLFDALALRQELPHVFVVIAGRPQCRSFFTPPPLWSHLIVNVDFEPFTDDDILSHFRQRDIPFEEHEIPLLLDLVARDSPAMMAQIGDRLHRARRGVS